ncbi:unnamed protein product [Prunus armeniaca]
MVKLPWKTHGQPRGQIAQTWSTGPAGLMTSDLQSDNSYGFNKVYNTRPASLVQIEQSDRSRSHNRMVIV